MVQENLKSRSGRSMVEMLGVLSIIGVLSVGGVYGYTIAMKKYKAKKQIMELHGMKAVNGLVWKSVLI